MRYITEISIAIPIAKARGIVQLALSETGADLRHRDHFGDPDHVRPGQVRAGNSRNQLAACRMNSKTRSPGSGSLPRILPSRPDSGSGQSTVRGGFLVNAEFSGRDRPRREIGPAGIGTDDCVNGRKISRLFFPCGFFF
jgi:hypothetical protein